MDNNKIKALNIMYGGGGRCGKTSSLIEELRANRLPLHAKCLGHDGVPPCSHANTDVIITAGLHVRPSGENSWDAKENKIGICQAYYDPSAKWRLGDCPLADIALKVQAETKKVTVNALKASKRAAKGQ